MTTEQARNAITIAQVARDLQIPRYGLQIAIATAIQESTLVNFTGGDRDSGGLFQQRPSQGWGSRAQITNPVLATRAFFGQARTPATRACSTSPAGRRCSSANPRLELQDRIDQQTVLGNIARPMPLLEACCGKQYISRTKNLAHEERFMEEHSYQQG